MHTSYLKSIGLVLIFIVNLYMIPFFVYAVNLSFSGTISEIFIDVNAATYSGTMPGSSFSGNFNYGDKDSKATSINTEPGERDWEFIGPNFNGVLDKQNISVVASQVNINIQNDHALDEEESELISALLGITVTEGTVVDTWTAGGLEEGASFVSSPTVEDPQNENLVDGIALEIIFISLDTSFITELDFQPLLPNRSGIDLAIFTIEEADESGNTIFAAIGVLNSSSIQFSLTASGDVNGTVDPLSITKNSGESQTFVVMPNSGFSVDQWFLDGQVAQIGGNSLTIATIQADHEISVSFRSLEFSIIASSGLNGTVAPENVTRLFGENQTFTATPNTGYTVSEWRLDDTTVQIGGQTYILENIQDDAGVHVSFFLPDRDQDGLPDFWEDPFGDLEAKADGDNDGIPNIVEFQEGLDPTSENNDVDILVLYQGWNLVSIPNTSQEDQMVLDFFADRINSPVWKWSPQSQQFEVIRNEKKSDVGGCWVHSSSINGIRYSAEITVTLTYNDDRDSATIFLTQEEFSDLKWHETYLNNNLETISVISTNDLILMNSEISILEIASSGDISLEAAGNIELTSPIVTISTTMGDITITAGGEFAINGTITVTTGNLTINTDRDLTIDDTNGGVIVIEDTTGGSISVGGNGSGGNITINSSSGGSSQEP